MTSKRLETAMAFISHFEFLSTEVLEKVLAEDYVHQYAPSTILKDGPSDKRSLIKFVSDIGMILKTYPVKVVESLESESSNAVTMWVSGTAKFRDEVKDDGIPDAEWEYKGQYMFLFYMDETGEKIIRTVEFVDSKAAVDVVSGLFARATTNLGKKNVSMGYASAILRID